MSAALVAVLADDLIWSTRLVELVRAAGAEPVPCRTRPAFEAALPDAGAAIVDLTSRSYDGIELIALAGDRGLPVIAVGQHDDAAARRRARAAGAERVLAYRALADAGPAVIGGWLAELAAPTAPAGGSATEVAGP